MKSTTATTAVNHKKIISKEIFPLVKKLTSGGTLLQIGYDDTEVYRIDTPNNLVFFIDPPQTNMNLDASKMVFACFNNTDRNFSNPIFTIYYNLKNPSKFNSDLQKQWDKIKPTTDKGKAPAKKSAPKPDKPLIIKVPAKQPAKKAAVSQVKKETPYSPMNEVAGSLFKHYEQKLKLTPLILTELAKMGKLIAKSHSAEGKTIQKKIERLVAKM